MYEEFYDLRELPFELTPNPKFLFLTPQHREALSNLQFGVQARKSLTLLVGDPGTGKTTLVRALIKGLQKAGASFLFINNPRLKRDEFLELLGTGFGLSPDATASKAALLRELEHVLKTYVAAGRLTALMVDEAQSLSDELLEEIRLLANIETDSVKLLPVVLTGHRALAERLNDRSWWQLKQRVSLRYDLHPLDLCGTAAYIRARVRIAGGYCHLMFTRQAVTLIHERSGGIPRVINTLCDNALIAAFAAQTRPVNRAIVEEVCRDLELGRLPERRRDLKTTPSAAIEPARAPSARPNGEVTDTRRAAERAAKPTSTRDAIDLPGSFEIPDWVGSRVREWGAASRRNEDVLVKQGAARSAGADSSATGVGTVRARRFLFF